MNPFPCLVRSVSPAGELRYALGNWLVDRYLEFVAGRCRPNTVRAVAFDLKVFFSVIDADPVKVQPAHVFEFLAQQRGDRSVVRMTDRESGLLSQVRPSGVGVRIPPCGLWWETGPSWGDDKCDDTEAL